MIPTRWEWSALLLPFDVASRDGRTVQAPRVAVEELTRSLPLPVTWRTWEDTGSAMRPGVLGRIVDPLDPTGRTSDRDVWVPRSIVVGQITRLSYVHPLDEGDEDAEQEALRSPCELYAHGHLDLVEAAQVFGEPAPAPGMVEAFEELAQACARLGPYGGLPLGATLDLVEVEGDRSAWHEQREGASLTVKEFRVLGAEIVERPQFHGTGLSLRVAGQGMPHPRSLRSALIAEILRVSHTMHAQARQDGLRIGDSLFARENDLYASANLLGLRTALALHDGLEVDAALPGGEVDQLVQAWEREHVPEGAAPGLEEVYRLAGVTVAEGGS